MNYTLSINDSGYEYLSSIDSAKLQAEEEIMSFNESLDSLKLITPECDSIDYALAISSGALCGIIDIFLVGKPGDSPLQKITDKWFEERVIDFANLTREKGESKKKTFTSALAALEKKFGIPYDQTGTSDSAKDVLGLTPRNHHYKSLGHNPTICGLFFSILDQFNNTSHFVIDGNLIILEKASEGFILQGKTFPAKIFCGFANWIGHLMSDVAGSSSSAAKGNRGMGIPSPLWSWMNDVVAIKRELNIPVTKFDESFNKLAEEIFNKGYDLRFQSVQIIPVVINELIVRLMYSIRRLIRYCIDVGEWDFKKTWSACEPFSNPTVKRMLTAAHGTFCLVDIGDATVRSVTSGQPVEFFLRVNLIGVGRFAFSLFDEAKRISYNHRIEGDRKYIEARKTIAEDYLSGLNELAVLYDDKELLKVIDDCKSSDLYIEMFNASAELAQKRGVPEDKYLKNKSNIDEFFGGIR